MDGPVKEDRVQSCVMRVENVRGKRVHWDWEILTLGSPHSVFHIFSITSRSKMEASGKQM